MSVIYIKDRNGELTMTNQWSVSKADPDRYGKKAITIAYFHVRLAHHVMITYPITMDDFRNLIINAHYDNMPFIDLREIERAA